MVEGCFVPEVYIVRIIRFVWFWWESWYLFAAFIEGLKGILQSHASWVRSTSCILEIIDLSHIRSFRRMNFNPRTNCGITLLFLHSWDFCTYREVLFGWTLYQILYLNQINAIYARIQDFWWIFTISNNPTSSNTSPEFTWPILVYEQK